MKSEYISLDDPRVRMHCTREGRVYHQGGSIQTVDEGLTYHYSRNDRGLHQEPRMTAVMAPITTWNLNSGDWIELTVEDVPLLGICMELAEHHWDVDLYIDGKKIYGAWYSVPTYLPSNDGYGYVHWLMMERGKHQIRLEVSDRYNRMLDISKLPATHACINGFILMNELHFPPPLYHTWMYGQDPFPTFTTEWMQGGAKGILEQDVIPAGGHLYLMDLLGRGTLDELTFRVEHPVTLEIIDGGIAQKEFPRDFPAWIRHVDLSRRTSGALTTVLDVEDREDGLLVRMKRPVLFGHRLMVRLKNNDNRDYKIADFYMEGSMKCM